MVFPPPLQVGVCVCLARKVSTSSIQNYTDSHDGSLFTNAQTSRQTCTFTQIYLLTIIHKKTKSSFALLLPKDYVIENYLDLGKNIKLWPQSHHNTFRIRTLYENILYDNVGMLVLYLFVSRNM